MALLRTLVQTSLKNKGAVNGLVSSSQKNVCLLKVGQCFSTQTAYTDQQRALGRPLSPFLEIYDWPITAVSSIMTRITGVALSCGFGAAGALALFGADLPALINSAQLYIPLFSPTAKFVVTFPIVYHFMGGARHIVWDNVPELLENSKVAPASKAMLGAATLISLGAALYTIKPEEKKEEVATVKVEVAPVVKEEVAIVKVEEAPAVKEEVAVVKVEATPVVKEEVAVVKVEVVPAVKEDAAPTPKDAPASSQ